MKAEMDHGTLGFWSDNDRSIAMAVLGPHTFEYMIASHLAVDGLVTVDVGDLVLGWDDDHLCEREDEESGSGYDKLRKHVLQRLHLLFGGSEDGNYAVSLDQVTDVEIFLASMYFSFPRGHDGPGRIFLSENTCGFR